MDRVFHGEQRAASGTSAGVVHGFHAGAIGRWLLVAVPLSCLALGGCGGTAAGVREAVSPAWRAMPAANAPDAEPVARVTPALQEVAKDRAAEKLLMSFAAECHFAPGSASIDAAGTDRHSLDRLIDDVRGRGGWTRRVTVLGYSDRVGDAMDNRALSERRAAAVAGYLASRGLQVDALHTKGLGAAEPMVACTGLGPGRALADCLAPNRRVVVRVDLVER